jgi:hypothetical protein
MTQKEVAIAILYQGDRVLFQLRKYSPGIEQLLTIYTLGADFPGICW